MKPFSASSPADLRMLEQELQDVWVDFSEAALQGSDLHIPIASRDTKKARDAIFDSYLRVGGVVSYEIVDRDQIAIGSFASIAFDERQMVLLIRAIEPLSLSLEVRCIDIQLVVDQSGSPFET